MFAAFLVLAALAAYWASLQNWKPEPVIVDPHGLAASVKYNNL